MENLDNGYYEVRAFNGLELEHIVRDFKINNIYYQRWYVGAGVKYKIMCKKEFTTLLALKYSCQIIELSEKDFLKIQ